MYVWKGWQSIDKEGMEFSTNFEEQEQKPVFNWLKEAQLLSSLEEIICCEGEIQEEGGKTEQNYMFWSSVQDKWENV